MQNQYVGDVGDYATYGLLRGLCGGLRLGVVWYLTPDETHKTDGRHVAYLRDARYRACDPALYDELAAWIAQGRRHVRTVEDSGVLGPETRFFRRRLPATRAPATNGWTATQRRLQRRRWLAAALRTMDGCDVVFLDPDNGVEVASVAPGALPAAKYAFWDELQAFLDRHGHVIVYQHLARRRPHGEQIAQRLADLRAHLTHLHDAFGLWFRPYSGRVFFVLTADGAPGRLRRRARQFLGTAWQRCFHWVQ